ncbi:DUF2989 domain-containing protein [Celerinatantimonas yamalensis]|uniref:DUF2989 domain-containing protein n=1 Tax=Celerinatantimonas yamalensis TaxID=559956 RepID=A0ABW9G1V5_9GAMM
MFRFQWVIVFTLIALTSGCDRSFVKSASQLCRDDSTICQDIPDEGWCTDTRNTLVRARWHNKHQHSDKHRYLLLDALQHYQQCIAVAAQIEPLKHKERKTKRTETLLIITAQLKTLEQQMTTRHDLYSLFYRWSQLGDRQARQMFLNREDNPDMQDPTLKWALASLYSHNQPKKSLNLMLQALSGYTKEWPIPEHLIEEITTEYMRLNQYDKAYIWSLVLEKTNKVNANLEQIKRYRRFNKAEIKAFEDQAQQISEAIQERRYHAPAPLD